MWHTDIHKRKKTGGKRKPYRSKRKFERGGFAIETTIGEKKIKIRHTRGGNIKVAVASINEANVTDPKTGKTQKAKIIKLLKNPANKDYERRGIITKGSIIETSLGLAIVTSRPGQNGTINAILTSESK
jgi:small subunit ribosomal protein S8e